MIENTIPEVNVDELMEKIREEVRERKSLRTGTGPGSGTFVQPADFAAEPMFPACESLAKSPPFVLKEGGYDISDFLDYHDEDFVHHAYLGILGRGPDMEGGSFYLDLLRRGTLTRLDMLGRIRYSPEGRTRSTKIRGLLFPFAVRSTYRIPVLGYFVRMAVAIFSLPAIVKRVETLEAIMPERLYHLEGQLTAKADRTEVHGLALQKADMGLLEELQKSKADRTEVNRLALQKANMGLLEELQKSKADRADLERLASLKADGALFAEQQDKITGMLRQLRDHKLNILDLQRRLTMLLEEARKRLPAPVSVEQIENMLKEAGSPQGFIYVLFEDQFRGTREEIKERQKIYLPYIRETNAGARQDPVLDLGCGRGEWLELLKEESLEYCGIDTNDVLISQCRQRGLTVLEEDVVAHLRSLPDASLGAITGFHIIEHLPFNTLVALLDEALRVLRPSGIVIFETPNPRNICVGACNFYVDPTHRTPLHPEMMRFLVESRGFCRVEILPLHPVGKEDRLPEDGSEIVRRFNEYFYGPQDYAVIGVKS
jgi:O-antigen chain-terminating methyltransferase